MVTERGKEVMRDGPEELTGIRIVCVCVCVCLRHRALRMFIAPMGGAPGAQLSVNLGFCPFHTEGVVVCVCV